MEKKTGDVPQIAVSRNFRLRGIGKSIIATLKSNTDAENLNFINVDERLKNLNGLLNSLGFQEFVEQYEMVLKLTRCVS